MTERKRKARKQTLSHGDLFHVYIASDTPPEVCEFLTQLKQQGYFSYDILQIIESHVKATQGAASVVGADDAVHRSVVGDGLRSDVVFAERDTTNAPSEERVVSADVRAGERTDVVAAASADVPISTSTRFVQPDPVTNDEERPREQRAPKMDPIQMLRQQRRAWVANHTSG